MLIEKLPIEKKNFLANFTANIITLSHVHRWDLYDMGYNQMSVFSL